MIVESSSPIMEGHHQLGTPVLVSASAKNTFRYYYYDIWQETGDPRINTFFLMEGGPWTVLGIIAAYVYFVKIYGPRIMGPRKAFSLKPIILVYNIVMVIINTMFFIYACIYTSFGVKTWQCMPLDKNAFDSEWKFKLTIGWLFVMSKFVDLLDTVFFVLKKNFHQVSALHVIHHSLVPINCWLGLKYVPSESAAFMPFINSFIHAVMYSYYALSSLGPHMRPYLWWKKYLTSMQIIQLALVTLHCFYLGLNANCNLPKVMFLAGIPQILLVLYMFVNFYLKSYVKSSRRLQNQECTPCFDLQSKSKSN